MLNVREHSSVQDAAYDTVHYSTDPVTGETLTVHQIATDTNVPASRLQDGADPSRPQPFHLTWIVPIVKRTQNYAIVRFLCRAVGGVFIKLPEATKGTVGLVGVIGNVMKEVADVVKVASEAITDDTIDAGEKAQLLQQIAEAKAALAGAEHLVQQLTVGQSTRKARR